MYLLLICAAVRPPLALQREDITNMRRHTYQIFPSLALSLGLLASSRHILAQTAPAGSTSTAGINFVGPSTCSSDGSTTGYSNTTTLFYDILSITTDILEGNAAPDEQYNFILCPYTVYDFGIGLDPSDPNEKQGMVGLIPLLDNSHYLCGEDGELSNSCVFKGGWYHILFEDDIPLNNVTFYGFTFERSLDASVMAYGQPNNDAAFINCKWKSNREGNFLVDNFWHLYLQGGIIEPGGRRRKGRELLELEDTSIQDGVTATRTSFDIDSLLTRRSKGMEIREDKRRILQQIGGDYPSMYLGFAGCSFENNELSVALISNDGGFLDLTKCSFESNKAAVVIANVMSAKLAMYGATRFVDNNDIIGPVFLDSTSTLLFHEKTTGENNIGEDNVVQCEGIFLEVPGVDCLNDPASCDGSCCPWGDSSCDLVQDNPLAPSPLPGAVVPSNGAKRPTSSSEGGCGGACLAFAILLPIVAIVFIASTVVYLRRRNRRDEGEEEEGESMEPAEEHNFS